MISVSAHDIENVTARSFHRATLHWVEVYMTDRSEFVMYFTGKFASQKADAYAMALNEVTKHYSQTADGKPKLEVVT